MKANQQGFSPLVSRYLGDIKGKKRQEVVNQIGQLNESGLAELEEALAIKYQVPVEVQPEVDEFTLRSMGMDEQSIQYMMGGRKKKMYYQVGGERGDTSDDILEQEYQRMMLERQMQAQGNPVVTDQYVQGMQYLANPQSVSQQVPVQQVAQPVQVSSPIDAAYLDGWRAPMIYKGQPEVATQQVALTPDRYYHNDRDVNTAGIVVIDTKAINKQEKEIINNAEPVKAIQKKLFDLKILKGKESDVVDGVFGAKTEAAVKAFQEEVYRSRGIKLGKSDGSGDGIVGSKTKAELGLIGLPNTVYKSNVRKYITDTVKDKPVVVVKGSKAEVATPKEQTEVKSTSKSDTKNNTKKNEEEFKIDMSKIKFDIDSSKSLLNKNYSTITEEEIRNSTGYKLPEIKRNTTFYSKTKIDNPKSNNSPNNNNAYKDFSMLTKDNDFEYLYNSKTKKLFKQGKDEKLVEITKDGKDSALYSILKKNHGIK